MGRWDGPPSISGTGARSRGCLNGSLNTLSKFETNVLLIGTYNCIFATCCMLTWISGDRQEPYQLRAATSLCSLFSIRYLYGGEERGGLVPAAACGSSF